MLVKTRGIVLHFIRYKESSVIAKIFTEELGLRSYVVNGVRNQKTSKIALYQPLTLLELVVYQNDRQGLQRISEAKIEVPFQTVPFNMHKISIVMFLNEVLLRVLREESANPPLFHFLHESLLVLDRLEAQFSNFHLQFLLTLTHHLGFSLTSADELSEQLQQAGYKFYNPVYTPVINQLIQSSYTDVVPLNGKSRSDMLEYLLMFYRLHTEHLGEIQSLEVLRELH